MTKEERMILHPDIIISIFGEIIFEESSIQYWYDKHHDKNQLEEERVYFI